MDLGTLIPVYFFQNTRTMDRKAILEELKKVLAPYTASKEMLDSINEQTDLIRDLRINSASLVDIIIDAEDKYNIEFDAESVEKITNVGTCIDIIVEKMNQRV